MIQVIHHIPALWSSRIGQSNYGEKNQSSGCLEGVGQGLTKSLSYTDVQRCQNSAYVHKICIPYLPQKKKNTNLHTNVMHAEVGRSILMSVTYFEMHQNGWIGQWIRCMRKLINETVQGFRSVSWPQHCAHFGPNVHIWCKFLFVGACHVYCSNWSGIPGPYPLGAKNTPPLWQPKIFSDFIECSLGSRVTPPFSFL